MFFRPAERAIQRFAPTRSGFTDIGARSAHSILARFMENGERNSLKFIIAFRSAMHHSSEQRTPKPTWWSYAPTVIE